MTERRSGGPISDRYEALIDSIDEGIVFHDRHDRVVLANPAAARILGITLDELLGRTSFDGSWTVRLPDGLEIQAEDYPGAVALRTARSVANLVFQTQRDDEPPVWVSANARPVFEGDSGQPTGAVTWFRDITEQREAAAELEHHRHEAERERHRLAVELARSQRLESLGRLTSGIAHDFNNLLGLISNYATFVARAIGPESPVADDIAAIQRSAKHASALTRELLLFSEGQVGHTEPFDLSRLVSDVVTLLRRPFGNNITLIGPPTDDPALVIGERGPVEQMIVNLLLNARDALDGSGTISITIASFQAPQRGAHGSRTDHADELAPGAYVMLSIVDDGDGMDPDVLGRAFEPFFSTKDPEQGTGLGLATVQGIAVRGGGQVTLDSEPGVGTTARVFLPAADSTDSTEGSGSHRTRSAGGSETILLVDDDDDMRALSRRILSQAGYRIVEAGDPAEAITLATTANAALLLTDISMPDIDGVELASRLCAQHPDLKVAFVSATARELGPDPISDVVVDKPFDADELLSAVRRALDAGPDHGPTR